MMRSRVAQKGTESEQLFCSVALNHASVCLFQSARTGVVQYLAWIVLRCQCGAS